MPNCPKCESEYREGYERCSECNLELVPELQKIQGKEYNKENSVSKWVFLINVLKDYELVNIQSILEANGIISMSQTKGSGEYIRIRMGLTYHGFNLFVPEDSLEEAREIINSFYESNNKESLYDDMELINHQNRRMKKFQILAIIINLPFLILILLFLLNGLFDIF